MHVCTGGVGWGRASNDVHVNLRRKDMLLCGYCKFSGTLHSCVMPRYVSSLELSIHTSCYVTVSSLELSSHASCHAIVSSLELSTHASCHAIVSSLELATHMSCHVTVSSQKSGDVNWNLGQIVNHTKKWGFA